MDTEGNGDEGYYNRYGERIKQGNLHKSLYETFLEQNSGKDFTKLHELMVYDGTIQTAIQDLRQKLRTPDTADNIQGIALLPPILVRGVIDYLVSNPQSRRVQSVQQALAIGLAAYSRDYPTALSLLDQYKRQLPETALNADVHQPDDIATWIGTEPRHSYRKAMDLAFQFPQKPLLLIGLGQGSTAAAMDVYLRHADITESQDSRLYVVRFSRNKKKDEAPRINEEEIKYLQETATGRQIVLFDEDSVTARTLQQGTDFFRRNVFPTQNVYPTNNFKGSSSADVY